MKSTFPEYDPDHKDKLEWFTRSLHANSQGIFQRLYDLYRSGDQTAKMALYSFMETHDEKWAKEQRPNGYFRIKRQLLSDDRKNIKRLIKKQSDNVKKARQDQWTMINHPEYIL